MALNVYEIITKRFIEELENGIIPWEKPWRGNPNGAFSRSTKKPYSLLNQMLLKNDGEYATFKKWTELGGKVKKGAKSEIVVFWKMIKVEKENENGEKESKLVPVLRYYNVFHISQVEGVEPLESKLLLPIESIAEAEKVKEEYKKRENIDIREIITNEAFYSPSMDYIQVPMKEQHDNVESFYSTLFHEMVHSTGHKSRLNRFNTMGNAAFGSQTYSKEELVAEMGAACILNKLGIETKNTFKNSTAYIQSWLKVLKNDSRFVVSAGSKAEKAVNYIFGIKPEMKVEGE